MKILIEIAYTVLGILVGVGIVLIVAELFGIERTKISTQSPCPACGNNGCSIQYDPVAKKVVRTCLTCGCVVRQPPVAPAFFESK